MSHSFNVKMVEEHEDGSATFTVSGDKASDADLVRGLLHPGFDQWH
jgi:hypothetical protein